jgi:hypothetical protein
MGWSQFRLGSEFRVTSVSTHDDYHPSVASDANGNFVVVWGRSNFGSEHDGVFGRRFDAAGVPQGGDFKVTDASQNFPVVASDGDGNFVVAYHSFDAYGDPGWGIRAQRYDALGAPQGAPFHVNSFSAGVQSGPSIAFDGSGHFVVVWNAGHDGSNSGIFGQRFDASGARQGDEFLVNTYTRGFQLSSHVARTNDGRFVVVWWSSGQDNNGRGAVFGQRYDTNGTPLGGEFRVTAYTTGAKGDPAVAMDAAGNFVVVWANEGVLGALHDGYGIFARRYDVSGVAQGGEFRVSTYITDYQAFPAIAMSHDGNFLVAWSSYGQDGSGDGVFARRFDVSGARSAEFQVNTYTTDLIYQSFQNRRPGISSDGKGNFVVVWTSTADAAGYFDVAGQRLSTDVIFRDDF